jgi:hypothetical protein
VKKCTSDEILSRELLAVEKNEERNANHQTRENSLQHKSNAHLPKQVEDDFVIGAEEENVGEVEDDFVIGAEEENVGEVEDDFVIGAEEENVGELLTEDELWEKRDFND